MALIQYITRIQFGSDSIKLLKSELAGLQISSPLLVTDNGIREAGILDNICELISDFNYQVYDQTPENPTEEALNQCLKIYREADCDGIIALGGGSPIDLAKAVALINSHGGVFSDYNVKTGGSDKIRRVTPHVAVPTAAGTGAEVGRACVMTTNDGRKTVATSLNMVAHAVICDPLLTLKLPSCLTAATGIDALSHGLEAFVSNAYNPPAQAIALDCIARAGNNLVKAYKNPGDLEARTEMMMAALEGGMSLQRGLGAVHAMSNPIGELGIHHGTINGVLLPYVIRYNESSANKHYDEIKNAIGIDPAQDLADWLRELLAELDFPKTLTELGVNRDLISDLAGKAAKDHLSATNPRPMNAKDYEYLLLQAL